MKNKLENIVFDFGNVLVHYEPSYIVSKSVADPADAKLVEEIAFDRLYWDRLDDGSITEAEVAEAVKDRLPERLHAPAKDALLHWQERLPEMEGMRELVSLLKNRYGKRICLLSNISRQFAEHADEIPILENVPERIFSSVCGITKPHKEIFAYLCEQFDLDPVKTVFIDDNKANIASAKEFGLQTYLFNFDCDQLTEFLLPRL